MAEYIVNLFLPPFLFTLSLFPYTLPPLSFPPLVLTSVNARLRRGGWAGHDQVMGSREQVFAAPAAAANVASRNTERLACVIVNCFPFL